MCVMFVDFIVSEEKCLKQSLETFAFVSQENPPTYGDPECSITMRLSPLIITIKCMSTRRSFDWLLLCPDLAKGQSQKRLCPICVRSSSTL